MAQLKSLTIEGNPMTDFVVEQGTSGNWTYRKWASGISECWGTFNINVLFKNESGSSYFTDDLSVSVPSGLFIENGVVNMNCQDYWSWIGRVYMQISTESVNFRLARGSNYTTAFDTRVDISVKGKWK